MDSLAANVETKSYKLGKTDTIISILNARMVCFYENRDSSSTFMPSDKLKEGFSRALTKFPWLLGHLKQTRDKLLEVVVDKCNLNMPIYRETQSDVHFSDINSADYNPETWPSDLISTGSTTCPEKDTGVIKLLNIHVVRLKENSGMIISAGFCHGVADGTSYFTFLNHWADETRTLITGDPLEEVGYCFDPALLLQYLPSERTPLSETTKEVLSLNSRIGNFIMRLSPTARGKLLNFIDSKTPLRGHLFRISHKALDELRSQVLECMPPGSRVSDNDLLVATAYKVHGQAELEAASNSKGTRAQGEHGCSINCNVTGILGMGNLNYVGNPLIGVYIKNPMDHAQAPLTAQTIADIAGQVRSETSNISPPYVAEYMDTFNAPSCKLGTFTALATHYNVFTITSNIRRLKMYDADFGSGVQAFTTVPPDYGAGVFIFMPSPSASKDIIVNVSASPAVMDCILKNRHWMELAEFVY
ncbi:hypothetical protein DL89DRAFT_264530 [Linderina pennispora]|uniref:Transferase-domain-containing protein n=1 Tax=Linderina pennispora TaxID=61395 RepID=A0A1Y1WMC5_9FUNG|nr:uncharacterized protein DL89DRAFT_264530 [Linderina pennispora]ORX74720.1 hypothetical protein DL89DRAFT_264530 [Linderina pennispora]